MRADAQRNRRLLLDAECRVFIEAGMEAPLELIARRAGVGIATLYRHFRRRDALVRGHQRVAPRHRHPAKRPTRVVVGIGARSGRARHRTGLSPGGHPGTSWLNGT
jgi:Bacterial regulatory proteins, tetR family